MARAIIVEERDPSARGVKSVHPGYGVGLVVVAVVQVSDAIEAVRLISRETRAAAFNGGETTVELRAAGD